MKNTDTIKTSGKGKKPELKQVPKQAEKSTTEKVEKKEPVKGNR